MNRVHLCLACAISLFAVSGLHAQATALDGQWKATVGVLGGQQVPPAALQTMSLSISGTSFTAASGTLTSSGTFALQGGDQIQFSITAGADAGKTLYAKYKKDGARLTIVYSAQSAPTDFNSTAGNNYLSMTYDSGEAGILGAMGLSTEEGKGGGSAIQ